MTLASHTPSTWNDTLSSSLHKYRSTFVDNVFNKRPLLEHLRSNDRVDGTVDGGESLVEQLMYAEGEADSYGERDTIDVTPQATLTAAQFPWAQVYATVTISGLEEAKNSGKARIVSLLNARTTQAEETKATRMNAMFFGTRGGAASADDFLGLPTLIAPAATAAGGIVNEAWWASTVDSGVGNNGLDAAGLETALRDAYMATSNAGTETVDLIMTNPYGFGFYESTLTGQVRYEDTTKANLGFQSLMYKNTPIMWDFQCSGGTEGTVASDSASFYGISSKYLSLKFHKDRNFAMSSFSDNLSGSVSSTGSGTGPGGPAAATAIDARVAFCTSYGQLCTSNRRRHFKITDVTSA